MRWVAHVAHMGEGRKVYRVLVGNPEGKGPLRRPRHNLFKSLKERNILGDLERIISK